MGFVWARIAGGYHCGGGHHVITDELLAEGKGGIYVVFELSRTDLTLGPYYAEPSDPKLFVYAGPEPRPVGVPQYTGMGEVRLGLGGLQGLGLRQSALHGALLGHGGPHLGSGRGGRRFPGSGYRGSRFGP
jgi:hypothetical protein